jgi:hypothetical protein
MFQSGQTFGTPDKQIPATLQTLMKFTHHIALGLLIEIDHDISAEYDIERFFIRNFLHEIEPPELNHTL